MGTHADVWLDYFEGEHNFHASSESTESNLLEAPIDNYLVSDADQLDRLNGQIGGLYGFDDDKPFIFIDDGSDPWKFDSADNYGEGTGFYDEHPEYLDPDQDGNEATPEYADELPGGIVIGNPYFSPIVFQDRNGNWKYESSSDDIIYPDPPPDPDSLPENDRGGLCALDTGETQGYPMLYTFQDFNDDWSYSSSYLTIIQSICEVGFQV